MPSGLIVAPLVGLLIWAVVRIYMMGSRDPNLPPGPPTIPVLGNAHLWPTKQVYLQFTEWMKAFGDIYSLKIGDQTMILNTPRLVHLLLDQRTAATADRPPIFLVQYINPYNVPLMRHGPMWKEYRRVFREILSREACVAHMPLQHAEASQLMYDLLKEPENFFTHIRRYSSSLILSVAFGLRCPRYKNSYISRFFVVQRENDTIFGPGGTPPLDIFPILKYVPERWAKWKTVAKRIKHHHRALWFDLLAVVEKRISDGKRQGCFMEDMRDRQGRDGFDRNSVAFIGSNLMEAGSDTTSIVLQWFMSMMTAYPEVRKRAQKEIDEVVGSSRSPTFDDWDSLPYVQAIIKEVHRFRPIVPQLLPHRNTEDTVIDGYVIPSGSTVFINFWGINHDPEAFDHPEVFNPDRFIRSEFGTREGADNFGRRDDLLFGSGRRSCPGMDLAVNSIKINAMNLLWGFDFDLAQDASGKPIPIDLNDTTDGVLLTQKPFKCVITPRSSKHVEVMRGNYASARDVFVQFEHELTDSEREYVAKW
ncbi:cytochrome P450 [Cristinia sonorae]|uniref:Cytochrome P450 n=1 Tax=Cristinia sonorae TaxID=1940300 RepID=A0A8K0UK60_9AGAR|nr:cytochrome P450 [Cristinia sonorae]